MKFNKYFLLVLPFLTAVALAVSAATDEIGLSLIWSSSLTHTSFDGAWGDYDGDGDLDLLVANYNLNDPAQRPVLYRNTDGQLEASPVWELAGSDIINQVAWADYDNDGDFDFATANALNTSKIYRNDGVTAAGLPTFTIAWSSTDIGLNTASVAWGDYNNDGRLDLLLGHSGARDELYRNDASDNFSRVWQADDATHASSVAWGDYDNNGFLDIAVANGDAEQNEPNQLYLNSNGTLATLPTWESAETDFSISVAWGDYNDDGRLDLAFGNRGEPNRIYQNVNNNSRFSLQWSSTETEDTQEVIWVDFEGDGDLDLIAADTFPIEGRVNRIYENVEGTIAVASSQQTAEADVTNGLAAGDVDNDGDFDLAVLNGTETIEQANRLYQNDTTLMNPNPVWEKNSGHNLSTALAWGDVDGDGDLDLAISSNEVIDLQVQTRSLLLFEFEPGQNPVLVWQSTEEESITDIAWGDYDGDGDLDLATAAFGENRLYRNDNGILTSSSVLSFASGSPTLDVDWGDYDGDGDLDIIYGNLSGLFSATPDALYRNDGLDGFSLAWSSNQGNRYTSSIEWGDYDNDGDVDLLMGNFALIAFGVNQNPQPNEIFENVGGVISNKPVWTSPELEYTNDVVWGDYDGDGDLDFAAGNFGQANRIYENQEGKFISVWESIEIEATNDIAWIDYDGDGDLDLATASGALTDLSGGGVVNDFAQSMRLYQNNEGTFTSASVWESPNGVWQKMSWGDYDDDGDLDVALPNYDETELSIVLENTNHNLSTPINNAASYAIVDRPSGLPNTEFFADPTILRPSNDYIEIPFNLFDSESDNVIRIVPEFSPNGGGQWFPATKAAGGASLTNLAASPAGEAHSFHWDMAADLVKSDNLVFRISVQSYVPAGPIMWGLRSSQSAIFRAEIPNYIRVQDEKGRVIPDALVFIDGKPLATTTDRTGLINPDQELPIGTAIVALDYQEELATGRACHDGWSYRVHSSSLAWESSGEANYLEVSESGPQTVTTQAGSPLIGYNLVVSIEWDASEAYLQEIAEAMRLASDYLYDVSDGQMAFTQVTIYENSACWAGADVQVLAKNIVRPHARIGGIFLDDTSAAIRIGRQWDGNDGGTGAWTDPNGYRTIIHEFGHYAHGLYDHYFGFKFDENQLLMGETQTRCTGYIKESATIESAKTNASIMDHQYTSSEFSMQGMLGVWDQENCVHTAQWLFNGESDWETIARTYTDTVNVADPHWHITTPLMRGGILAGPDSIPAVLPSWPEVITVPSGSSTPPRQLIVKVGNERYQGALVALYKEGGAVVGQGVSDENGELFVYGAESGDRVQVASFDGSLSDRIAVDAGSGPLTADLTPVARQAASADTVANPHLIIRAEPGSGETTDLIVSLPNLDAGSAVAALVTEPGATNNSGLIVDLGYSAATDGFQGALSFSSTKLGTGSVQALIGANSRLQSTYRLVTVVNETGAELVSDDGNFELFVEAKSLLGSEAKFVINESGFMPGGLPSNLGQASEAYSITASGSLTALSRPGVLRLNYDNHFLPKALDRSTIQIYRWDYGNSEWIVLESEVNEERQEVSAAVNSLGVYALLYSVEQSPEPPPETDQTSIYLPIIVRN